MKKTLCALVLYIALSSSAHAETIDINVNGLVCEFCAQGIEAKFKKVPDVDQIRVDLDNGLVHLHTTPNATLTDDAIQKIITEAGYTVVIIKRST